MEMVVCNRLDGIAFSALNKLNCLIYILSSEKNKVEEKRAKKIKVPVIQGVKNKSQTLKDLVKKNQIKLNEVCYVGNDINDFEAMKLCGFPICPADSHKKI